MKICAIICEYNPFHNGHFYQLDAAKKKSGADAVVCFMSGNFVQRGEAAVLGKYIRAKHAVLAGADAVVELPVVFSSAPAELFAKGAIKLISSVPEITALSFGCESGDEDVFFKAASLILEEPAEISAEIKRLLKEGFSFARARTEAWKNLFPRNFLSTPNNILGIEYAKALLLAKSKIRLFPVQRKGNGHTETTLSNNFSSASAIRAALEREEFEHLSGNLPLFVLRDLSHISNYLSILEKAALIERDTEKIRAICDCTEGLENALKKAARRNETDIVGKVTSKRYTSSRIRRILLHNLLGISRNFIEKCMTEPLYLNLLSFKKGSEAVLSALGKSSFPLLTKGTDARKLKETAKECYELGQKADAVFSIVRDISP